MRLFHFAFGLTVGLLFVTAYLAWQGQQEAQGARKELEFMREQQRLQTSAGAVAMPSVASLSITPPAPGMVAPAAPTLMPNAQGVYQPVGGQVSAAPAPLAAGTVASVQPQAVVPRPDEPPGPPPLTPLQNKILNMPAIAKVKNFVKDQSFVVLDAGSNKNIASGALFEIRRGNSIVGRVKISDAVEAEECIADVDPKSIPAGVEIVPGDDVI
ncbi:MAG: hypothetical protein KDK97_23535, partial [Verrucomicrobiales bacterium]|nr:hypothetical protein [Verrucomicrobiales bacterium]